MATQKGKMMAANEVVEQDAQGILDQILDTGIKPRDDRARDRAVDLVRTLVNEVVDPGTVAKPGVVRMINERIAAIDQLLSDQLNAVMHHPEFQKLEAAWRGLHQFVMTTETGENMQIRVFAASKSELLRDFSTAAEFTESSMWRKIYQGEYGVYGGDPYGALIGDYEFDKGPQDVALLGHMGTVASAAHAPFISGTSPAMFGLESFSQLGDPRDLAKIFDKSNPENTKWLSFRDSEDSRYVSLCLPHVLARLPYGKDNPCEAFDFREDVDGTDHDRYLWSNAAYSFGSRLTDAFAKHHWCVAVRGAEGGGRVEGLPVHVFQTREGLTSSKCPTEVQITDDREKELTDLGFLSLVHCKNTDYATFFGGCSAQRPKKYMDADATANAFLSAQIPYLMTTSRIAHYLKVICRDKVGSFMSRGDCEMFLNKWISNYVLAQDEASQDQKAKFPLREAKIEVVDDKSRPGCYRAVAHLKPHFQLEELNVSLRLVAELPASAK